MLKKIYPTFKFLTYILWVPLILSISFEIVTFSDWIYEYNWSRNNISYKSGLPNNELNKTSTQLKRYFKNNKEKINLIVEKNKSSSQLFNKREIDHMVDVKNLITFTLAFEKISLVLVISSLIFIFTKEKLLSFYKIIYKTIINSFLIWSGMIIVIILGMLINFNYTFTLFHKIFFRNDLWLLNPNTDYLLILFPERFFLEISIFILLLFFFINILILLMSLFVDKFIASKMK